MAQGRRELPPALTSAALADLLRDAITRPLAEAAPSLMALALTGPWQGAALAGRLASGAWGTLSETGSVDPGCDQRQWALQDGPASLVVPIDKTSIVLTVAFAWLFLGERLTRRSAVGLALIVAGTALMLL